MIPQATPLYVVADHVEGVDLFLVVGWMPLSETHAAPLLVTIVATNSTGAAPSSVAELYHQLDGEDLRLQYHDQIAYHVDLAEARQDYAEAVGTWNARGESAPTTTETEPDTDRAGHQLPCSCAAGREPQWDREADK
jgi:hypothetical protein